MKRNYTNILIAGGLILIAAAARIANREMDLHNLAPVAALGLFSGAVIKDKRISFLLPLFALLIADLYFEFFSNITYQVGGKTVALHGFYGQEQVWVYAGMSLVTILGMFMGNISTGKVLGFSLTGSLIFFIVSNFGIFMGGLWGTGFEGLVTTYTMAIPFFRNSVASDLLGSGLLFGLYFLTQRALSTRLQKHNFLLIRYLIGKPRI